MISDNIASAFYSIARTQPDKVALVGRGMFAGKTFTFSDLRGITENYSVALKKSGIRPGMRVMLMVPPSAPFYGLTFALFALGAVVILIDPGMGYKNLLRCIGSVRPEALIGIQKAHLFRTLFRGPFKTVTIHLTPDFLPLPGVRRLPLSRHFCGNASPVIHSAADDLAAIIFTTGSTGPPKGVQYTHGIFQAQLRHIREYYGITRDDCDQPAFPLFGLFSMALGARVVIPRMDPTRPAEVNPQKFIDSIQQQKVTYSFGSPALWQVVSRYCAEKGIVLESLKKVLMAGAPVPGDLLQRTFDILPHGAEIHTPYGATESLPIVSMQGREIVEETWPLTRQGRGTCVGRPLPGMQVKIITPVDGPIVSAREMVELPSGEIGEIIVQGDVVTRAYDNNEFENAQAKIRDGKTFWHRIGDLGYFDARNRLWFCGRKAHRVMTSAGILYTICCEALFNEHPAVRRSALVGVGEPGRQQPVIIVELAQKDYDQLLLRSELAQIAAANTMTRSINQFLVHESFPVDIRHNAKIFREKLAVWAEAQLVQTGGGEL